MIPHPQKITMPKKLPFGPLLLFVFSSFPLLAPPTTKPPLSLISTYAPGLTYLGERWPARTCPHRLPRWWRSAGWDNGRHCPASARLALIRIYWQAARIRCYVIIVYMCVCATCILRWKPKKDIPLAPSIGTKSYNYSQCKSRTIRPKKELVGANDGYCCCTYYIAGVTMDYNNSNKGSLTLLA